MKTTIKTKQLVLAMSVTILFCATSFAQSGPGGGSGSGKTSKLEFKNPAVVSGTAGRDNAVYKFGDIGENLDARIKIKGRSSSLVYLVTMDMKTSGFDKAWQPQVGYNNNRTNSAGEWWMDFEVSFVKKGTTTAATIDQFDLSAIDIDGNGDKISEYVSFYGLKSYTLERNSLLSITDLLGQLLSGLTGLVGKRFDGPTVNQAAIDTSGTSVMVTTNYQNVKSFTVRIGAVAKGANSETERMYSLYYQSFNYTQPSHATLPVKLKSFDTKLNDSKVQIDWTTAEEVNFSHFIIERSTNGADYKEIATHFSNANAAGSSYTYNDAVNTKASGLLYYRLKMVDQDGEYKYSNVRIVKLNASNEQVSISAYPNPVTNELRITIPANWQNKQVSYELINLNGVIVKQQVNQHASQTETLMVNNLQSGNYVVRLRTESGTAVQMIAKK
jgi:hypothetical protein